MSENVGHVGFVGLFWSAPPQPRERAQGARLRVRVIWSESNPQNPHNPQAGDDGESVRLVSYAGADRATVVPLTSMRARALAADLIQAATRRLPR